MDPKALVKPRVRTAALQNLWIFEERELGIFQPYRENVVGRWEDLHLFDCLTFEVGTDMLCRNFVY
jgi:hypothetical protein